MKIGLWFMMTGISFIVLSRNPFDRRDKCCGAIAFMKYTVRMHISLVYRIKSKSACRFFNRILLFCFVFFPALHCFTPIYLLCERLTFDCKYISMLLSSMWFSFVWIWCSYGLSPEIQMNEKLTQKSVWDQY